MAEESGIVTGILVFETQMIFIHGLIIFTIIRLNINISINLMNYLSTTILAILII